MTQDISKDIVKFAIETQAGDLPNSARDVMKLSLLDWVAVAIAGKDEPVSKIVRDMVAQDSKAGPSQVVGLEQSLTPRAAAMANGVTSHALDYDDTHFIYLGHPSAAVVPAALAIAEAQDASLSDLIDAALIGVELACRIGHWIGDGHYRKGFHITATAGCFGAAMAAARLMKLNETQTLNALSIAASRAAGIRAQFGTMGKPYHTGMAASSGVEAAILAEQGFIAADRGLDDPQGFAETHDAQQNNTAFEGLGQVFVFETVQHKLHACCHGLHATLEALNTLKTKHDLSVDQIEKIMITVQPRYMTVCNLPEPRTGLEAKFSYRLTSAMALLGHDTARLDSYTDALCQDATLIVLRDKVFVQAKEGMSGTIAEVSVTTKKEGEVSELYDLAELHDVALRRTKVLSKAASLISKERAEHIWSIISKENGLLSIQE